MFQHHSIARNQGGRDGVDRRHVRVIPWGHDQKPPYETNTGRTWDQFRKMSDSDKRGSDFHVAFDCYDDDHMIVINCLDYDFDELCDRGEVHIGSNQKLIDKASVSSCFTNYGIPCKYFRK
jgi:hypothetical protein